MNFNYKDYFCRLVECLNREIDFYVKGYDTDNPYEIKLELLCCNSVEHTIFVKVHRQEDIQVERQMLSMCYNLDRLEEIRNVLITVGRISKRTLVLYNERLEKEKVKHKEQQKEYKRQFQELVKKLDEDTVSSILREQQDSIINILEEKTGAFLEDKNLNDNIKDLLNETFGNGQY